MEIKESQFGLAPVNGQKQFWGIPSSVISFVVIAIVSAIVYRIVTVEVNLQFDFPSFLSMFLALFAVGLSALFYFKTTETSNIFYDNTHKFTREVSQILGRIEAGFGERLRHLDEGYSGLMDKFDKLPFDLPKAREQEQEEKLEVAKKEAEFQEILNDLAKRAELATSEKDKIFSKLRQTQNELARSKSELLLLQERIRDAERPVDFQIMKGLPSSIIVRLLQGLAKSPTIMREFENMTPTSMNREFRIVQSYIGPSAIDRLRIHGLIDNERNLTERGFEFIRELLTKNYLEQFIGRSDEI